MSTNSRTRHDVLMAQFQEMWGHLDTLFEDLNVSDGWDQKHGPDWTFADVPYHLAYCNNDIVARGLRLGWAVPGEEMELSMASPGSSTNPPLTVSSLRPFWPSPTPALERGRYKWPIRPSRPAKERRPAPTWSLRKARKPSKNPYAA